MSKKELISSLFVILCLYEDVFNIEKTTTKDDYIIYLNRKYLTFLGRGDFEIAYILEGLKKTGTQISHKELKSIVFHMISLLEKEE